MEKNPRTLEDVIQYVKATIHNQRLLFGSKKTEIREVSFQEDRPAMEDRWWIKVNSLESDIKEMELQVDDTNKLT